MGKDTRPAQRAAVRRHYARHKDRIKAQKKEIAEKKRKRLLEKYGTTDVFEK